MKNMVFGGEYDDGECEENGNKGTRKGEIESKLSDNLRKREKKNTMMKIRLMKTSD